MYSPKRRFRLFRAFGPNIPAGSSADVLSFARTLSTTLTGTDLVPTDGGALTLNSQSVGNYEVTARKASTTVSSFNALDWFTNTKDTTSSWIIVNGDLTINSGQTLIPPTRKLFTVVYVKGNLTINGSISMTARGANHSGTGDSGGYTAPVDIRIGTGTFSAVTNPQIPSAGGAGGGRRSTQGNNGGTAGSSGGTGGGGSGTMSFAPPTTGSAGAGAAGTCFSGGGGGGSIYSNGAATGENAGANGGKGGDGGLGINNQIAIGGPGNPGGTGYYFTNTDSRTNGTTGTAGVVIVICEGSLTGSGSVVSDGGASTNFGVNGSGGGGGSVNVLYGTNPSGVTVQASSGGNGGNGTARKLAIGAN